MEKQLYEFYDALVIKDDDFETNRTVWVLANDVLLFSSNGHCGMARISEGELKPIARSELPLYFGVI
jgi:hypothetical protein